MKIKTRITLLSMLLAASMLLATGCGPSYEIDNTSYGQQQFSFSIVYAGGDLAHKQGMSTVIADFERSHPNIQVNEISSGSGSYLDFLRTKDAVGEFPDLVEMRDTQMFADAGLIAEMPTDIAVKFRDVPTVNGKVYNAPITLPPPMGIMYSKKLFREAGINQVPGNLEEFMQDSEAIKKRGITPLVVGGKDIWHMGFWINKFLIDDVLVSNPNWNSQRSQKKVSWTDPAPVKAMEKFVSLWKNGFVEPDFLDVADNQTASYLVTGKAAMLYSGPWMFRQIHEADSSFEFGFFALPGSDNSINVPGRPVPSGWSISSEAAGDPEKLKVVKQFLHFFYSDEEYPKYLEPVGGIPATGGAVTYRMSEQMSEVMRVVKDPAVKKSWMINSLWGVNELPTGFRDWFYQLMQQVVIGKFTLHDAMVSADKEWDKRVQEAVK